MSQSSSQKLTVMVKSFVSITEWKIFQFLFQLWLFIADFLSSEAPEKTPMRLRSTLWVIIIWINNMWPQSNTMLRRTAWPSLDHKLAHLFFVSSLCSMLHTSYTPGVAQSEVFQSPCALTAEQNDLWSEIMPEWRADFCHILSPCMLMKTWVHVFLKYE